MVCHRPATLLKTSSWHRCFSVNFAKFDRTPFGCFWISKKMLLQAFSDTLNWIYNIHKKIQKTYCKRFEHIPCLFRGNIFDYDWILYGTSSSSIDSNELFASDFSHFICRWLVKTSNGTECSCNRQDTFSIDDDNLQEIQETNCDQTSWKPPSKYCIFKKYWTVNTKIYITIFKIIQQHS